MESSVLGGLLRDIRDAGRTMRMNPFFVLFVVLTFALGIGANTSAIDPISVAAPAGVLVACYWPARSAGRLDPLAAWHEG